MATRDREPSPTDGPDWVAEHAAWSERTGLPGKTRVVTPIYPEGHVSQYPPFDDDDEPIALTGVVGPPPERSQAGRELFDWWIEQAIAEANGVIPKMEEYGGLGRAVDLVDIGRDLLRSQQVPESEITDEWATETGIYFYIRGKIGRWTAAITRGDRISDDTLKDISVYCRMAQRARQVGGWPV